MVIIRICQKIYHLHCCVLDAVGRLPRKELPFGVAHGLQYRCARGSIRADLGDADAEGLLDITDVAHLDFADVVSQLALL